MLSIPILLTIAWLLPLGSFLAILFWAPRLGKHGSAAGLLATVAIAASFVCALAAASLWFTKYPIPSAESHHPPYGASGSQPHSQDTRLADPSARESASAPGLWTQGKAASKTQGPSQLILWNAPSDRSGSTERSSRPDQASRVSPRHELANSPTREPLGPVPLLTGDWYVLAEFGHLRLTLGYYIDTLTILMVLMVTLVATLIHIYSLGYMHEELHPEVSDQEILAGDPPQPIRRPGRFARFFQYLSLFCFSMLGLVLANNLFMIFIFWELVGICSYLLIGFYLERPQAVRAASKAFIVNRVGDFGMLVGLAAWWGAAGTFHFADSPRSLGLFSRVAQAELDHNRTGQVVSPGIREQPSGQVVNNPDYPERPVAYGLLVLGGLGVFCGCVGKSAQFPLHVWLPDAMEGPTPVSALIHAATMVAAGVYLVGRFYPAFPPEVLLVVAVVGLASLLLAGMMALAATEIKRVLAFSTISQLGLMMFALGVGGWTAGLFHLLTHAFFKALLFLGAGSVIHCVGTGDMGQMGGLVRKIPWTAGTMLVGCLAIAGAGIPPWVGLSGFHSKDAVLAQAYLLMNYIPGIGHLLFSLALIGAAMTAFYMFRLWYLVFWGRPRSLDQLHHAHESPPVMVVPLVVLSVFAIIAGWRLPGLGWGIAPALEQARPISFISGQWWPWWVVPPEAESHQDSIHVVVSWLAFTAAAVGFVLATLFYGTGLFRLPSGVGVLNGLVLLLQRRFFIDELYQRLFVAPALHLASWAALIDRKIIDNLAEKLAAAVVAVANSGDLLDRKVVDGSLVGLGQGIYGLGRQLRQVQTGLLRQYLLAVVVGTIVIFVLVQFL